MLFSLEVIQAKYGDCLMIHYGDSDNPKHILIDGGPGGVYRNFLKPRLVAIKETLYPDGKLPLAMVMVSHMDADHVVGIINLAEDITDSIADQEEPIISIDHIWYNTFDSIIGNLQIAGLSNIQAAAGISSVSDQFPELKNADNHRLAVVASTPQGQELDRLINEIGIAHNVPFDPIGDQSTPFVRGDNEHSKVAFGGIEIEVLHPNQKRLEEMQAKWDKDLTEAAAGNTSSVFSSIIASRDKSPFNLASIVCLFSMNGKTILSTGDARDDDILTGLRSANKMDNNDHIHVDVLKIPHHGSDKNVSRNFFEKVTADHYVISGNGHYNNPDKSTLIMIQEATNGLGDNFTIHFTNANGSNHLEDKIQAFIDERNRLNRTFKVEFIKADSDSLSIDLLEDLTF